MTTLYLNKYEVPIMLPCPFCGGKASIRTRGGWEEFDPQKEYDFGDYWFTAGCGSSIPDCDVQPRTNGYLTPQTAAEIWNRRLQ
jgi:hypothetical protein